MTLKELEEILQNHSFAVESNGIIYKFIGNTLNINSKPITFYMIEETDKGFYLRTTNPIAASNPLLLLIDNNHYHIRITLVDEYSDSIFCVLISQQL